MSTPTKSAISATQRKPLAACVAALFALVAPEVFATTWLVTSCANSGTGSLRDIVGAVSTMSGDTVDLSACSISGISLTTGAITIAQTSLVLQGPTTGFTTVTGYYQGSIEADRVLNHTGTGNLILDYLRVSYGNLSTANAISKGGCIYSKANVFLIHTQVLGCTATGLASPGNPAARAYGGGIYTHGNLIAKYSQIVGNTATGGLGFGGGASVHGNFSASNSTINGNTGNLDGGVYVTSGASIANSTISGNTSTFSVGGMYVVGEYGASSLTISDSTISGNVAQTAYGGGVLSRVPTTVQNSTIAFNTAAVNHQSSSSADYLAPGLAIVNPNISPPIALAVNLESSILSNNTYGSSGNEEDFSGRVQTPGNSITITSNNSIVRASLGPVQPATVTIACPLLGPLRNNGGLTQTHALLSHSPAINAGNNNANLSTDQRGSGYPRVSGPAPDIGAYEVQQNDIIFNSSFEGCPDLS